MKTFLELVLTLSLTVGLWGCGTSLLLRENPESDGAEGDSTPEALVSDLSEIPDVSTMFRTNDSSGSENLSSLLATRTVSGTPPYLKDISESNADTHFWNGLTATIVATNTISEAQASQFWGETEGGPGGEIACRMAQTTGYTMASILRSATSLCYMKNAPAATEEIADDLFTQEASDKVVRVPVTDPVNGNQNIFLKVYGSDSITGSENGYWVDIWFCPDGQTTAMGYQTIRMDCDSAECNSGTLTITDVGGNNLEGGSNSWNATVTGTITRNTDNIVVFDSAADRTASFQYTGDDLGPMKSAITVTSSNQIITKDYHISISGDASCATQVYSLAGFSGSSMEDLVFNEAGVKGSSQCGDYEVFTFSGGTEFQGDFYVATPSSAPASTAGAFDLDGDSFFQTAPAAPTVDTSAYDCSAIPDVEIAMDMINPAMAAVAETCEPQVANAHFCDSGSSAGARSLVSAAPSTFPSYCRESDDFSNPDTLSCFSIFENLITGPGLQGLPLSGGYMNFDSVTIADGVLTLDHNEANARAGQGSAIGKMFTAGDFSVEIVVSGGLPTGENEVVGIMAGNVPFDDGGDIMRGTSRFQHMPLVDLGGGAETESDLILGISSAWMKITRTGNTYTYQYKTASGDSYTTLVTETRNGAGDSLGSASTPLFVGIYTESGGTGGTFAPQIDAFNVLAGNVEWQD